MLITEQLIKATHIFKGGEDYPLLAPRGVFLVNGLLMVADTGQNRVFIWRAIPKTEFQIPDVVLGQMHKEGTGRNASGQVSAHSLMYPSGLWSDGKRLVVADAWNHRVLVWNSIPEKDGQPADVVIGQADFSSNEPNRTGVGAMPSAQSLYWPYGVFSDGKRLWIADTGNRRVLFYEGIPDKNGAKADGVIGKPGFDSRDYDHLDAIWPYSVKISPQGQLAITDTQYYRVLLWDNWIKAFSEKADTIIGQASFEDNGQNQFGWFPKANTLNWCYDTCFYKKGMYVADTGNSRILWFENLPTHNNSEANQVLGQDNFNRGIENKNAIWSTPDSLYWPFHLSIANGRMAVADTGNHRIVIHKLGEGEGEGEGE